jgi:hypothetical protein
MGKMKTSSSSSTTTPLHSLVVFRNIAYAVVKAVHTNGGRFLVHYRSSPQVACRATTSPCLTNPTASNRANKLDSNQNNKNSFFQEVSKAVAVSKAVQAIRHQAKKVAVPIGVRQGDGNGGGRSRNIQHHHHDDPRRPHCESTSFLPSIHCRAPTTSTNGTTLHKKSPTRSPLSSTTETSQLPSSGDFIPILPCLRDAHDAGSSIAMTTGTCTSRDDHGQQLQSVVHREQLQQEQNEPAENLSSSVVVSPPLGSHTVPTILVESLLGLRQSSSSAAVAVPSPALVTTAHKNRSHSATANTAAASFMGRTGKHHQPQVPLTSHYQQDAHSASSPSSLLMIDRLCTEIRMLTTMLLLSSSSSSSSTTTTSTTTIPLSLLLLSSPAPTALEEVFHHVLSATDLLFLHKNDQTTNICRNSNNTNPGMTRASHDTTNTVPHKKNL